MTTTMQSPQPIGSEPVAPPTPQEISRKLSVHNKPKPKPQNAVPAPISGTESDSESYFSPDHSPPTGQITSPGGSQTRPIAHGDRGAQSHGHSLSLGLSTSASSKPLSSIAEIGSGSHDDESDEDEDNEGDDGWQQEQDAHALAQRHRADGESVIKTGYLLKKGERRKTWKKRWFVLRSKEIAVYKNSQEYRLLRLLDLSDVHSCTPVELKKHVNAFCLVLPNRTYYLEAPGSSDMQEWVKQVNLSRESLLGTSTQNSFATPPIPIPQSASHQANQHSVSRTSNVPGAGLTPSPPSARSAGFAGGITSESDSEDQVAGDGSKPGTMASSPSKAQTSGNGQTDPSKVVLQGYLMKSRSKRRGWRKRYFMLSSTCLIYSANHMDSKRRRVIDLSQVIDALDYEIPQDKIQPGSSVSSPPALPAGEDQQLHDNDTFSPPGAQHTFKIVTTKRSLILCAPSEAEGMKWLSTIRALIARRSNPPTSNPTSTAVSPAAIPDSTGGGILGSGVKATVTMSGRKRSASGASTLLLDAASHH